MPSEAPIARSANPAVVLAVDKLIEGVFAHRDAQEDRKRQGIVRCWTDRPRGEAMELRLALKAVAGAVEASRKAGAFFHIEKAGRFRNDIGLASAD
jgi:hypothetical protein